MSRGEVNVDPVHDEFFKAQDLTDALVREAVQNSLDARRGRAAVRVRFRLATGAEALEPAAAAPYLHGLREHAAVAASEMQLNVPHENEPMPFLVVEDYGTRGLVGDPNSDPELDVETADRAAHRNDFYYFWRNVGRSSKGEMDRGRWGLGKAVFSVTSRIRAIFGLTLRADEDHPLLLGQCVLRTHVANGRRVSPYGFWGRLGREEFPLPVEQQQTIDRFIADFALIRDEPGLSIVVPFPREEDLSFERLIDSVTRQYFYPITRGDLLVLVENRGRSETIDQRSVERIAASQALAKLIALTRWSTQVPDEERVAIPEPSPAGAPKWADAPLPRRALDDLQHRFESGERLAIRVALSVKRKKGHTPAASHFDVILEKDESLKRGEHHFIRRGITIPEVRSARDKPTRALLVVEDEPLSTFLGDAENPAHSDWSERNDKIRALYDHGPSTLRYVKNGVAQLVHLLGRPPEGRVRDFLADLFSIDVPSDADGANGSADDDVAGDGGKTPAPQLPPIAPSPGPRLALAKSVGGFTIRGDGDARQVGRTFVVDAAYRTRSGNPFRKYHALDFVIGEGDIQLHGDGAELRRIAGNRISVTPAKPDFAISVSGFDRRRDVVVRIGEMTDDAPETQLY